MRNVTISMPDDLHNATRVKAAKAGKSMSRYIADRLREPELTGDRNLQFEAIERFLSGPPLHISTTGKMPTAEERNEREWQRGIR